METPGRSVLAVEFPLIYQGGIRWLTLMSEEDDGWAETRLRERLKDCRSITCGQLRLVRRTVTEEILDLAILQVDRSTVQQRGR